MQQRKSCKKPACQCENVLRISLAFSSRSAVTFALRVKREFKDIIKRSISPANTFMEIISNHLLFVLQKNN